MPIHHPAHGLPPLMPQAMRQQSKTYARVPFEKTVGMKMKREQYSKERAVWRRVEDDGVWATGPPTPRSLLLLLVLPLLLRLDYLPIRASSPSQPMGRHQSHFQRLKRWKAIAQEMVRLAMTSLHAQRKRRKGMFH